MLENIEGIKHFFLKHTYENLWRASFGFRWPEIHLVDKSVKHIFHSTFTDDLDSVADMLEDFIHDHCISLPFRIRNLNNESYPAVKNTNTAVCVIDNSHV